MQLLIKTCYILSLFRQKPTRMNRKNKGSADNNKAGSSYGKSHKRSTLHGARASNRSIHHDAKSYNRRSTTKSIYYDARSHNRTSTTKSIYHDACSELPKSDYCGEQREYADINETENNSKMSTEHDVVMFVDAPENTCKSAINKDEAPTENAPLLSIDSEEKGKPEKSTPTTNADLLSANKDNMDDECGPANDDTGMNPTPAEILDEVKPSYTTLVNIDETAIAEK